uniref:Haloacid dehalogenase-like hydrolase n=1 Tax=Trieres chinensis TaxID=1514140 RepID=A0A7S2EX59_TRICV|mmetsp:Transcript_8241/g.17435  ORF Transcript_8241/g.17435 Transcript_8241/m.17435 type:complete len:346 (+) Transcript_8241:121-1158(+)|eukprot:CAMPEP_0183314850 /NCGR_PEP_ID=MMETSP0160_2-20130417/49849_1 /TAXON_ID=2839 ORGANISM="Odontella Sinensis, Strain Grunow 1884" /NCGR_SAMPLE_ID=MMETSP0160_2 /ASSEMBLY_ACC=CAM_ASM_000250 /LENGTH=345 /DNA_ID=CAMNT_0025480265 /DNA_START=23 /DNA_END=1060 /DNA_ORIENTATION=-
MQSTEDKTRRLIGLPLAEKEAPACDDPPKSTGYRMVALDLDGTLLGSDHKISDASVEYLRRLHDRGFVVAVATGRSPSSTIEVTKRLDFPFSKSRGVSGFPIVCLNGARGLVLQPRKEPKDDERPASKDGLSLCDEFNVIELFHQPVPREITEKTLRLAREMDLVSNYYIGNEIHAQALKDTHKKFTDRYTELTGTHILPCDDDYAALMEKGLPSKLIMFCETDKIDEVHSTLVKELGTGAHVIRGSPPWFVEILNKDVCKGKGLGLLCKRLGVRLDETIAFGDGDNDIEFLSMAGHGIAMKNGRENLKAIADDVTQWSNEEDGVIQALSCLEEKGFLHFPCNEK